MAQGAVAAWAAASVALAACHAAAAEPARALRAARGPGAGAGQCWSPPQAADGARCAGILAALSGPFEAAPKAGPGLATPAGARHLLRAYFDERGWRVTGLEPQAWRGGGPRAAGTRDIAALLPALAGALFDERADAPGLALEDVAAFAAAVESFLFDEGLAKLEKVISHYDVPRALGHYYIAQRVLTFALFLAGPPPHDLHDFRFKDIGRLARRDPRFSQAWVAAGDAVQGLLFARRHRANPFRGGGGAAPGPTIEGHAGGSVSLEDLARLLPAVHQDRGGDLSADCGKMKEDLMARSRGGNGLVPLAKFWQGQQGRSKFRFSETKEHLKAVGALDETSGRHPQVRIPNYMLAPMNCDEHSPATMRCCLNECELVMKDVERLVRAPMAEPAALLGAVGNVSTSSVDAPRRLSSLLVQRLHAIAAERGGQVPLHGRVFAEWLHLAFPNECPFPHSIDDGAMRTIGHWAAEDMVDLQILSDEERAEQHRLLNASEEELHAGPEDFGDRAWVDETLHFPAPRSTCGTWLAGSARAALLVAMGALLVRVARASLQGGEGGAGGARGPKSA